MRILGRGPKALHYGVVSNHPFSSLEEVEALFYRWNLAAADRNGYFHSWDFKLDTGDDKWKAKMICSFT